MPNLADWMGSFFGELRPKAFKTLYPTAFGCKVTTFVSPIIPRPGSAARTVSNKNQVNQPTAGGRQAGPQGAQHLGIWPGGFELVASSTRALALSTTCSRPGCCRGGRLVLSFSIP
jgi:hypothetical protein